MMIFHNVHASVFHMFFLKSVDWFFNYPPDKETDVETSSVQVRQKKSPSTLLQKLEDLKSFADSKAFPTYRASENNFHSSPNEPSPR